MRRYLVPLYVASMLALGLWLWLVLFGSVLHGLSQAGPR